MFGMQNINVICNVPNYLLSNLIYIFLINEKVSSFSVKIQWDFFEGVQMRIPVDAGRKDAGRLLNILCTFNLRPVSTVLTSTYP